MKLLGDNVSTHLDFFTSPDALGISFDVQDQVVTSLVQPTRFSILTEAFPSIRPRGSDRLVTNFYSLRHNIQRGIYRSIQESLNCGQNQLHE